MKRLIAILCFSLLPTAAMAQDKPVPPPQETPDNGGFVARLGVGTLTPAGKYADVSGLGMQGFGTGQGIGFAAGYYLTRNVGLLAGGRYTFNHDGFENCRSGCSGMTLQLPVLVEYATRDRKSGLYMQGGFGVLTRYSASVGTEEMIFSNDLLEYKLGVGYRFGLGPRPTEWSIDVGLGADFGQFNRAEVKTTRGDASASIDTKAWHAAFGLSVAIFYTN
jgi:hypothetical protein